MPETPIVILSGAPRRFLFPEIGWTDLRIGARSRRISLQPQSADTGIAVEGRGFIPAEKGTARSAFLCAGSFAACIGFAVRGTRGVSLHGRPTPQKVRKGTPEFAKVRVDAIDC